MERVDPSRPRQRLNTGQPARWRRPLLFISVGLNLGLILFFALMFRKAESERTSTVPLPDNTVQASGRTSFNAKRATARVTAASLWKQLESTDLAVYAANLRDVGCPPKTVRDILLPWFEEKFKAPLSEPINIWASFSERQTVATARARKESTLRQQKEETLKEVLGFAWTSEGLTQAYAGEAAETVGFLDYDRAEQFLCVTDRSTQQSSRVEGPRRSERRSALYDAWRQEIGEIVSVAELEEIELRAMLAAYQRRNPNICKVGLSGPELRQLMAFRRELRPALPSSLISKENELLPELDSAGEQQFQAKMRSLLGDSRFLEYLKHCDASIERTLAALKKEQLPESLALELFDFRQEALARAQEIRQLPVRRAEKRVQLAALRQNVLEQVAGLSNGATESALFQANEDWLQEIAHP